MNEGEAWVTSDENYGGEYALRRNGAQVVVKLFEDAVKAFDVEGAESATI